MVYTWADSKSTSSKRPLPRDQPTHEIDLRNKMREPHQLVRGSNAKVAEIQRGIKGGNVKRNQLQVKEMGPDQADEVGEVIA
jgi:hypothetical protein